MRFSLRLRFSALLSVTVAATALGFPAVQAQALAPWWHLASTSRPAYLQPGQAKDEVQQLVVPPGGAEVEDEGAGLNVGYISVGESSGGRGQTVGLVGGETTEKVALALEGMYGTGNIEVTGGPPSDAYEVKFVGKLADLPVGRMEPANGTNANVNVLVNGRPDGLIIVTATNLGDANEDPELEPVTVSDVLPPGLEAVGIAGGFDETVATTEDPLQCSVESLSCMYTGLGDFNEELRPYQPLQVRIAVNLKQDARSGEENLASISGGDAPSISVRKSLVIDSAPVPFGVSTFEMRPEEVGGGVDTKAGSHPFQFTTTIDFNETFEGAPSTKTGRSVGLVKDLSFKLPPGLIGNPSAIPRCKLAQFLPIGNDSVSGCLPDAVIGVARVVVSVPGQLLGTPGFGGEISPITEPLFNVEPAVGEPARFGFVAYGTPVLLDTAVRTGSDYGAPVNVGEINQLAGFLGSEVTF